MSDRNNSRRAEQRAARALAAEQGIGYQAALDRVRSETDTARVCGPAPTPDPLVELHETFRGYYRDGWADSDIERALGCLGGQLNLKLRCVWEHVDEHGCGGHSDLVCLTDDGQAHALPDGLWDFLVDGTGDGRFARGVTGGPHPEVTDPGSLVNVNRYDLNLAFEDRREPDADALADAIDTLTAEQRLELWEDYSNVMTDLRDYGRRKWADRDEFADCARTVAALAATTGQPSA